MDDTPSSHTSPTLLGRLRRSPPIRRPGNNSSSATAGSSSPGAVRSGCRTPTSRTSRQIVLTKLADKMRTFAYDPAEKFSRLAEDPDQACLERLRRVAAARREGDRRQRGGGTLAHAAGPRRPGGAPGGGVRPRSAGGGVRPHSPARRAEQLGSLPVDRGGGAGRCRGGGSARQGSSRACSRRGGGCRRCWRQEVRKLEGDGT